MRHRATLQNLLKILQSQNIPLLHWPGNSPDMNPIENMWEVVKRKSERREHNN